MTAQESNKMSADAGSLYDYTFKNIESDFLEPILYQTFMNMLYYTSNNTWKLWIENHLSNLRKAASQDLPEEVVNQFKKLAEYSAADRVHFFGKAVYFRTRVFSAIYDKQIELEKLTYLLGTIKGIPEAVSYIKWRTILDRMLQGLNYDSGEILRTDSEAIAILNQMRGVGMDAPSTGAENTGMQPPPENFIGGQAISHTGVDVKNQNTPPGLNIPGM